MKIAIYTAIFGKFDKLKTPAIINKDVSYICFTEQNISHKSPWEIRVIKPRYKNLRKEARRYKILSHNFLKEYDITIWIDGNYRLIDDPVKKVFSWLKSNNIAVQKHPKRSCIYDEAKKCITSNKGDFKKILKQIQNYENFGYSKNKGLVDSSILIRKRCPEIEKFNRLWWKEIKKHSVRDQISFSYIADKLKVNYSIIPIPNPRKKQHNNFFILYSHGSNLNSFFLRPGYIYKFFKKIYNEYKICKNNYRKIIKLIKGNLFFLYLWVKSEIQDFISK